MNAKITETENRPENTAADATDFVTETKERLTTIEKNLTSHYKSDEEGFTSLGNEIDELRDYIDNELNKSEKKTAASLEEIKARIADAEEQIVIAQKTAEGSNTAADAPDLRAEIKDIHKRIDGLRHYLDTEVKSYVDTEFFKTNAKFKSLKKTIDELDKHAIKGVDLNEIPEGAVLDAEPVANSTGLRAVVISDSMSIAEINDVMKRLSRHMEDLPASETSAVISMLSETAENIKALLDRLHLR